MKKVFSIFCAVLTAFSLFGVTACSRNGEFLKLSPFTPAEYDAASDGLPWIHLTIQNNTYEQISADELEDYGFGSTLAAGDLGEYIGTIDETPNSAGSDVIVSDEPALKDSKVYYYAPIDSEAVIILVQGSECSAFILTDIDMAGYTGNSYYSQLFELFGVAASSDITKISYKKWLGEYDENNNAVEYGGEITAPNEIKKVYDILTSDDAEINDDSVLTSENSAAVWFTLYLSNGLIIGKDDKAVGYYPFGSSAAINNKGELSAQQNDVLREVFDIS